MNPIVRIHIKENMSMIIREKRNTSLARKQIITLPPSYN